MVYDRHLINVLIIMDPPNKLDLRWDNSIALAHELTQRGIACWIADSLDIMLENSTVWVLAKPFQYQFTQRLPSRSVKKVSIDFFDLALIRKEPPFDLNYYAMTLILEHASIPIFNSPRGIREANEKMWGLRFATLMPETLISSKLNEIVSFSNKFNDGVVIKPLYDKGGRGVFRAAKMTGRVTQRIKLACAEGKKPLVCQRFLKSAGGIDKRIVILDGQVLCAFEKHPSKKDFRANLGLGATAYPTRLTQKELSLVKKIAVPLRKSGIALAGIDVMEGMLLEVNVTSPAGMTDAETLYPGNRFIAAWADWLLRKVRKKHRHFLERNP